MSTALEQMKALQEQLNALKVQAEAERAAAIEEIKVTRAQLMANMKEINDKLVALNLREEELGIRPVSTDKQPRGAIAAKCKAIYKPGMSRKDFLAAAVAEGVNPGTASTQYAMFTAVGA